MKGNAPHVPLYNIDVRCFGASFVAGASGAL